MFMLGVEMLHTTRLVRVDTWRKYVELDNFQQTLELLMNRKQGSDHAHRPLRQLGNPGLRAGDAGI